MDAGKKSTGSDYIEHLWSKVCKDGKVEDYKQEKGKSN